jgi:protein phosphatase
MKMYAMTDVGCKRSSNQDAFCCSAARDLAEFLVLCDGMGGHRGGNLAAEIAVRAFHEELSYRITPDLHLKDLKSILSGIIARISALIADAAKHSEYSGMGSTVVLAVRCGKKLCIAHVGDSRAYLFRYGTLRRLTKDHSLVQGLIDQGEISPEEGENHPHRNVITRSLGYADDSEPEILMSDLRPGDVYLLCTDGLTVSVKDDRLQEILRSTAPEDLAGVLVARALENGCPDNVTVGILAEETKEAKKQ